MASVSFRKVCKSFGTTTVVEDLDLELADGSMTVLVGPSGCGKTTSLRMLAGLEEVSSGTIDIGGRDVTHLEPRDRDISMVFQNYALYPHLTVRENIAFPLRAKKMPHAQALARADEVAQTLGLSTMTSRKPKDLSGGQQQRVAIGRAIVREPSVFLFDEPLSNLDAKLRVETRTELLRLQRQLGVTSLYVTHDQEEAMTLSDRMVVMRDGQVVQADRPDAIYRRPVDTFVAAFVGSPKMNLVDGVVSDGELRTPAGIRVSVGGPASDDITIGIRPDDLILAAHPTATTTVELVELLGPRAIVTVRAGESQLTSVVDASLLDGLRPGTPVKLTVTPAAIHRFDRKSGQRQA